MTRNALIILNRTTPASSPGWIHIVPKADLVDHETGITQVVDDKALDSILENLRRDKARLGDRWPGLYAGEEHFIYDDSQSSQAFAWFKDFEKRPDGIWASDDGLTDIGREAIQNRRFKFTSFCTDRSDVENLGNNRVRILKIETVGFTNHANGKEFLSPITNRQTSLTVNQPRPHFMQSKYANRITNRARQLEADHALHSKGKMPQSWWYQLAKEQIDAEEPAGSELLANRNADASAATSSSKRFADATRADAVKVMNRAKEIARDEGIGLNVAHSRACREFGFELSTEKPAVKNRSDVTDRGASLSTPPDVATIAARAADLQRATPGLSLSTAYAMASRESGAGSSGTITNRAASSAAKVKMLCNLVFDAAKGSNFDAGWDKVMRQHPELFSDLGIKLPDEEDEAAQS